MPNSKTVVVCLLLVGLTSSVVSAFSVAGVETVPLPSPPAHVLSTFVPDSGLLSLNLQQLATLAMNPLLNNQSLRQLYGQSVEIMNGTGADSVLFQLDPLTANETSPSTNQSLMVLAVDNPNEAAHQDLLTRFRLYFVNLTAPQNLSNYGVSPVGRMLDQTAANIADNTGNLWSIFNNFLKNQANAAIGAIMMPLNVGASAFHHAVSQHAEYVISGSNFGSSLSAPIILRAVALPNVVNQYILNVTGRNLGRVQNFEQVSKQASSAAVDIASDTVLTGARLVTRFAIRPVAAFAGFNLQFAGNAMSRIGQGISNTGLGINFIGNGLNNGAVTAVSAGATAIAWAMDNTTYGRPPTTEVEPVAAAVPEIVLAPEIVFTPETVKEIPSNVVEVNNNQLTPLDSSLFDASFNDTLPVAQGGTKSARSFSRN